jgi:hypothetical protein
MEKPCALVVIDKLEYLMTNSGDVQTAFYPNNSYDEMYEYMKKSPEERSLVPDPVHGQPPIEFIQQAGPVKNFSALIRAIYNSGYEALIVTISPVDQETSLGNP